MPARRTLLFSLAALALASATPAAAQQKLVVYTANESNLNHFIFDAFSKETGIQVEPVEAGSGVLFRRIASEREHPLGDIVWGVSRALLRASKPLLAPYASQNKAATPPEFRDADDAWIGTNVHLLVILQNTKQIPDKDGPTSWSDLLDPKWKGKISFTDPANSGSAYSTLTMLDELWGPGDKGWDKIGQLLANTKVLNRSSLVFQGVGNGEFPLGISLEYAGYLWQKNGAPVKVVYPKDGTIPQMEGVAIIKGGPNTEAAKKFVDYITRKDVREAILGFAYRRAARTDLDLAKLPGGMPQLSALKVLTYDEDEWVAKRAETMKKIQDIIRKTR
ncbi:MAG TPA: extracellular solute-binding protein [Xanthobacteraceae bacterium]|nr:extracellular solute-binding protein [Xanthobacteraceae bacterium]